MNDYQIQHSADLQQFFIRFSHIKLLLTLDRSFSEYQRLHPWCLHPFMLYRTYDLLPSPRYNTATHIVNSTYQLIHLLYARGTVNKFKIQVWFNNLEGIILRSMVSLPQGNFGGACICMLILWRGHEGLAVVKCCASKLSQFDRLVTLME